MTGSDPSIGAIRAWCSKAACQSPSKFPYPSSGIAARFSKRISSRNSPAGIPRFLDFRRARRAPGAGGDRRGGGGMGGKHNRAGGKADMEGAAPAPREPSEIAIEGYPHDQTRGTQKPAIWALSQSGRISRLVGVSTSRYS